MCPLWTSTAGEKLNHRTDFKCNTCRLSSRLCFLLIKGEVFERHQDVFWTAGRHQAVCVDFAEPDKMIHFHFCVVWVWVFTVSCSAAVRPYTEEAYTDDTMTVHQVPIFGEFRSVSYFLILTSASESVSNRELIVTLQLSQRITAGSTPPGRAAPLEVPPLQRKTTFTSTAAETVQEVQVSPRTSLSGNSCLGLVF